MNWRERAVETVRDTIGKIGKVPLCNERADRAPHICGKCFILCWRCTSLISSMLVASFMCWLWTGEMLLPFRMVQVVYAGVLILPTLVDGVRQYFFRRESTNKRRVVLGCISGVGLWVLAGWLEGVWERVMYMKTGEALQQLILQTETEYFYPLI